MLKRYLIIKQKGTNIFNIQKRIVKTKTNLFDIVFAISSLNKKESNIKNNIYYSFYELRG